MKEFFRWINQRMNWLNSCHIEMYSPIELRITNTAKYNSRVQIKCMEEFFFYYSQTYTYSVQRIQNCILGVFCQSVSCNFFTFCAIHNWYIAISIFHGVESLIAVALCSIWTVALYIFCYSQNKIISMERIMVAKINAK